MDAAIPQPQAKAPRPWGRWVRLVCKTVLVYSFIAGVLQMLFVGLTNDTNIYMRCALRLWLYGHQHLYENCIDENAPFHIVAEMPLAILAAHFHLDPGRVLHSAAFLLGCLSLLSVLHVLKAHQAVPDERLIWLTACAFALFAGPPLYGVFADREHLLFILALPWIIQKLIRARPLNYTCVLAALGFCMKPYDFVIFGILTLMSSPPGWTLKRKLLCTSSLIIGGIGLLYVACVILFFPYYITDMVPMALTIYTKKHWPLSYKLGFGLKYFFVGFCVPLLFVRPPRDAFLWLGFMLACGIVFILNAGWEYTFYLLFVPMILAASTPWNPRYARAGRDDLDAIKLLRMLFVWLFFITFSGLGNDISFTLREGYSHNHYHMDRQYHNELRKEAGDTFIFLSNELWSSNLDTFAGKPEAVFGYDVLWTYPWLYDHQTDPRFDRYMHMLTDPFLKSVQENPTATIIEDVSPGFRIAPGGVVSFLRTDSRIDAALKPYFISRVIDFCGHWRVYGCRFAIRRRFDATAAGLHNGVDTGMVGP